MKKKKIVRSTIEIKREKKKTETNNEIQCWFVAHSVLLLCFIRNIFPIHFCFSFIRLIFKLPYCGPSQQLGIRHSVLDIHRSLTFSRSLAHSLIHLLRLTRSRDYSPVRSVAFSTRTTNVLPISLFWFRQFYILYIEIHSYRRLPFKRLRIYFNWSRMFCCYVSFFFPFVCRACVCVCVNRVYDFDRNDFSYKDFRWLCVAAAFLL